MSDRYNKKQGYTNVNDHSDEEYPSLPQLPSQLHHAPGANPPPNSNYVPNSRLTSYGGQPPPPPPPPPQELEHSHTGPLDPNYTSYTQLSSNYTGGQFHTGGTFGGTQPQEYADNIQLLNVDPRPLPQQPPVQQPVQQQPLFHSNQSFDNLRPTETDYSYATTEDPFHANPFNESDVALQHALQANNLQQTGYVAPGQQHTGYLSPGQQYGNTSYEGNSNSNLASLFQGDPENGNYNPIQGDSYNVNPISPSVALYDNQMNPITLGQAKTGASTNAPFSQGVFISQNLGSAIDQGMQNQIQGQFEQNNQYAPDDPHQQLLQGQQEDDEEEQINADALFLGNLALDCPIPNKLAAKYKISTDPSRQAAEFVRMKYTAVTSEPERFLFDKFTLRQQLFKIPRAPCEMMIVVTMYNEDDILLGRTLKGIFDNLKFLCTKADKEHWGPDGWKKVVVAVVSDGRTKINPRARALLANLGVYQEGFAQSKVLKKHTTCHLYEHTTLANISSVTDTVNLEYDDIIPVQLIFALKEKNQKKINSHRWCFQALAPALQPEVIVLFDAGTEPTKRSIYELWREFHKHPNVGGACGEIKAMLGPKGKFLYNGFFSGLLVAGQNFEYKMSNILDKPTESVFGFISVLPGAFSAYRFEALKNDEITGHGPLEAYFKGETLHISEEKHDLFANNMYLAEDRILCFEIVTKKNSNWVLRYVKSASASTDVPDELPEFISQRRRWLNGSFFAAIYAVVHFGKIYRSRHSFLRKLVLQIEFVYNTVNIIISWFSVGSYFLVFRILTLGVSANDGFMEFVPGKVLAIILLWFYIACTMSVFIFAFGNKPKGARKAYWVVTLFYAVMMGYMLFCAIWLTVKSIRSVLNAAKAAGHAVTFGDFARNGNFRDLVISMGSTYILYFLASFLYGQPWHMFTSFIQYLLLSPMYINILNIYAFCNIHDISWGTKGDDGSGASLGSVKKADDGKGIVLDIPTTAEEVDLLFDKESSLIGVAPGSEIKKEPTDPDELAQRERDRKKQNAEDKNEYYAFVRSMVVLFWCVTNGVLIALVLNVGGAPKSKEASDKDPTGGTNATTYLTVILWLVAVLAAVRFIGSMTYLASRVVNWRRH